MLPRVLAVGSSSTVLLVRTNRLLRPRETAIVGQFPLRCRRQGCQQGRHRSRAEVTLVARVRDDGFGSAASAVCVAWPSAQSLMPKRCDIKTMIRAG